MFEDPGQVSASFTIFIEFESFSQFEWRTVIPPNELYDHSVSCRWCTDWVEFASAFPAVARRDIGMIPSSRVRDSHKGSGISSRPYKYVVADFKEEKRVRDEKQRLPRIDEESKDL